MKRSLRITVALGAFAWAGAAAAHPQHPAALTPTDFSVLAGLGAMLLLGWLLLRAVHRTCRNRKLAEAAGCRRAGF